ncbi:MAG: hypothetical protein NVS4B3_13030 [Gemmatimonadaceae bacterium]
MIAMSLGTCTLRPPRPDSTALRDTITTAELRAAESHSAYEVIARLRPRFLRDRGPTTILGADRRTAAVFLDDVEYGSLETLKHIPANRLREIRFFPGTDAVTRFGAIYHAGVIQLLSRYD